MSSNITRTVSGQVRIGRIRNLFSALSRSLFPGEVYIITALAYITLC